MIVDNDWGLVAIDVKTDQVDAGCVDFFGNKKVLDAVRELS